MSRLKVLINTIKEGVNGIRLTFFSTRSDRFGYLHPSSCVKSPAWGPKQNIFIYENCGVNAFSKFVCQKGKFILRRNCSVGPGLTVITCNHKYDTVGERPEADGWSNLIPNDVVVNEDVWIGANVTLCPGTTIGRGAVVAAGSVCVKGKEYPPYSVIGGNPAKFIKFRLSLEDQLLQEKKLYDEKDQIEKELLINNFSKFSE